MEHYGASELVNRLMREHPGKAADILARCCREDHNINSEILSCFLQPRPGQHIAINLPPRDHARSASSQHSTSPSQQRRASNHRPYTISHSSSSASQSTRSTPTSGEYILLIDVTEGGVIDKPVRMKTASVRHSFIRDNIARENMSTVIAQGDNHTVSIPNLTHPNACTEMHVSETIELSWRRPSSETTHRTSFFLVPRDVLSTDVLLGYEDSGEGGPDYPAPQPQRQYVGGGFQQGVRPPAPTPPAAAHAGSFHRSALSPAFHRSQHSTHNMVESYVAQQHTQDLGIGFPPPLQPSSPSTARNVGSTRVEYSQATPIPATHSTTSSTGNPSNSSRRLRLNLMWDVTTFNVWLDLDDPADAFFLTFQQQVSKRKTIHDRSTMTIYLKPERQSPNNIAYPLSLDSDSLDADWIVTKEWLEENKKDRPPHIFGTIEVDEG